jgi:hypothetical protein
LTGIFLFVAAILRLRVLGDRAWARYNQVNAFGSAIFFVTNDHTGNIIIQSFPA